MTEREAVVEEISKAIWNECEYPGDAARLAVSALEAAGYVIVKREPTEAMLIAGYDARNAARGSGVSGMTIDAQLRAQCFREDAIYRAMIAAQEQKP